MMSDDRRKDSESAYNPAEDDSLDGIPESQYSESPDADSRDEEPLSEGYVESDRYDDEQDEGDPAVTNEDDIDGNDDRQKRGSPVIRYGVPVIMVLILVFAGLFVYKSGLLGGASGVQTSSPERLAPSPEASSSQQIANGRGENGGAFGESIRAPDSQSNDIHLDEEMSYAPPIERSLPANTVGVSDSRIDSLLSRLDELEGRVSDHESSIQSVERRLGGVENSVASNTESIDQLESRFSSIRSVVSEVDDMLAERRRQRIEAEGNINIDVPEFAQAQGRERMVGYMLFSVTTGDSEKVIVLRKDNGELEALNIGSDISYRGDTPAIRQISPSEDVILVGDNYFIDGMMGVGPENEVQERNQRESGKSQEQAASIRSDQPSAPESLPESQRPAINGWVGVAKMRNGSKIVVDLGPGHADRFITLVEGEPVKRYGRVQRIGGDGTIYFSRHKINFAGR